MVNRENVSNNPQSYYYKVLYMIEGMSIVDNINKERVLYGREDVDVDSKMSHDVLREYVYGRYQQLQQVHQQDHKGTERS